MSVKKDPSGRRWVQAEIAVPGTPEQVWEAIATGPGVSSWFVPTEVRDDGAIVSHFGPGMDAVAIRTAWDPPHRFAGESRDLGPGAPALATEWVVEARSGGACIVRVVHSLFASTDDWDDQLSGFESGWPAFFRVLQLYLTHFRGWPCSTFRVLGVAAAPEAGAWEALRTALGLTAAPVGGRWTAPPEAPPLAGSVDWIGGVRHLHELLLLDQPAPGIALLNACSMGPQVFLQIALYLYGDGASVVAARHEPVWHSWMNRMFPAAASAGLS
jgi:uncharacterized protein YndB with AHSA1/START domain